MRNIKTVGLVALAALALSGLWAASASAQQAVFESNSYPVEITGTQEGAASLRTSQGTVACNTTLSGEITSPTKVASLGMSGYCESFGSKYSFKMNGCSVQLTPGWNAFGFGPAGCGPITIQVAFCTISIPVQSGLYASSENTAGGVRFSVESSRLRYSGKCAEDNESGGFSATWNLSGVHLAFPYEESLFAAESYPATLTGSQETSYSNKFSLEAGAVECSSVTYSASLTAASNPLATSPSFSGCRAFGFNGATVAANECKFVNHVEEEGAGENYPFDISCPEGKSITISVSTCSVSIPAQTGLKAVNYQLVPSSPVSRATFRILNSVKNLSYTVTKDGLGCPFSGVGTQTSGSFTGNALFEGRTGEGRPMNVKIGV